MVRRASVDESPARGARGGAREHARSTLKARLVAGACVVAALLASASSTRIASALEPSERPLVEALRVEPDACLDAAGLAVHVTGWLHRSTLDRRLEVLVSGGPSSPAGVKVTLVRDGVSVGERRFESLHVPCEEARAAVGLAIALAIDGTLLPGLAESPPPAHAPVLSPVEPPVTRAPVVEEVVPREPAAHRTGLGMSLDLVAVGAVLPTVVAGIAPSFEIIPHRIFELRISGLATFPESPFALGGGRVGASIYAGRVDGCAAFRFGASEPGADPYDLSPLRLRGCGGVLAGVLHTSVVSGLEPSSTPDGFWAAAALRFDARVRVTRLLGLSLSLDALIPLVHPDVDAVTQQGAVVDAHPLGPAGVMVGLGPYVLFR